MEITGPAFQASLATDGHEVRLLGPVLVGGAGLGCWGRPPQPCWPSPSQGGLPGLPRSHVAFLVRLVLSPCLVLFLVLL